MVFVVVMVAGISVVVTIGVLLVGLAGAHSAGISFVTVGVKQ